MANAAIPTVWWLWGVLVLGAGAWSGADEESFVNVQLLSACHYTQFLAWPPGKSWPAELTGFYGIRS